MSRNYSPEELKIISQDEVIPKDELYEIEAIINHRGEPGNREYLVRWKNYSKDHDSWLTAEAFTHPESINIYWRKLGKSINLNGEIVKKKNNEAEKNKKQKLPSDYTPSKLLTTTNMNEQSKSGIMSHNRQSYNTKEKKKSQSKRNGNALSRYPKRRLHQNQESSDRKIDHHEGFVKNAVTANSNLRHSKRIKRN
ncbi:hypothetical protein G6F30_013991 [Rhizopus arrhizus]|nr:hypothetical protein G6F30_013991 [Rhizopus arrhizus]KAG0927270.1 hypothetical protein G6F31_018111 [Rhizopus arrhizus]KAG1389610.1 hypothetical protein G6F59_015481 [Rhizopus arrhizus]